jgi:transcriptional regulator with XRE-family HTH domain
MPTAQLVTCLHVRPLLPMLEAVASIGANLKRLRETAGYATQGAFAKALGVPQPRVSDWENDRYDIPEAPTLLKIAKTLRVSIDQLLEGVDEEYDRVLGDRAPQTTFGQARKGDAVATAIAALQAERARHAETMQALQDVASRFFAILADDEATSADPSRAAPRPPGRSSRARSGARTVARGGRRG